MDFDKLIEELQGELKAVNEKYSAAEQCLENIDAERDALYRVIDITKRHKRDAESEE